MLRKVARRRDEGVALLATFGVVIALLGVLSPVVMLSSHQMQYLDERTEQSVALYLAESGIAGAKSELVDDKDLDKNGIGNREWFQGDLSYATKSTDLGGGFYQISSTGTSGSRSVLIDVVFEVTVTSRFPGGAISLVGDVGEFGLELEADANLIIDGGNSPAISFSDVNAYNRAARELASAIHRGDMPASNVTGTPMTTFQFGSDPAVDLPLSHDPQYNDQLKNLKSLYTQMASAAATARASAQTITGSFASTYGSPTSPVVVYAPNPETIVGQSITGYGTLVVGNDFRLGAGTTFDWHGDIFVVGSDTAGEEHDAEIKVEGANLTVSGSLSLLGVGANEVEFGVRSGGSATVNGSLLVASDWNNPGEEDAEAELEIKDGGTLAVNGVVTMMGSEIDIETDSDDGHGSNQANQLYVTGMLQVAVPTVTDETELDLDLEGAVEIHKDDQNIENAMLALDNVGMQQGVPLVREIVSRTAATRAWRRQAH